MSKSNMGDVLWQLYTTVFVFIVKILQLVYLHYENAAK